jgi:acyl carrier protein
VRARIRRFLLEDRVRGNTAELTDELPLLGGILDSVGLAKLVVLLEEEFGIEVGVDDLRPENFQTIDSIARFVASR